jgi:hypothetical protein
VESVLNFVKDWQKRNDEAKKEKERKERENSNKSIWLGLLMFLIYFLLINFMFPNPDKPEPKRESCGIGRGPKAPYTSQRLENERSKSFLKKWQLSLTNIVAREQNHMNAK